MTELKSNELLELLKQYQNALFESEKFLLDGVKIATTVIIALLSVQSGFMLWSLQNTSKDLSLAIILSIIPIGIVIISIIGFFNSKREYRNELEYISCLAKVEDEINFSRKIKKFFKCEESILCKRWLDNREKYDTVKEFKNDYLKIRLDTSFGLIAILYISIIILSFFIVLVSFFLSLM